nr:MAG TPA: hypothetical protein [Caudoviricetes sp.]
MCNILEVLHSTNFNVLETSKVSGCSRYHILKQYKKEIQTHKEKQKVLEELVASLKSKSLGQIKELRKIIDEI